MKELFRLTYMESVYPVSQLASLPTFRMGDHENQEVSLGRQVAEMIDHHSDSIWEFEGFGSRMCYMAPGLK